ncbi:MAG TPA: SGNH/GDSL hydrolase family protein, partial [Acidimicrobiia bacterium]|nr:SGNH/GDSL hydrolase family protein [Acidimicrobiia bacterium]
MRSGTGASRWIRVIGLVASCGLAGLAAPAAAGPSGGAPAGGAARYVALGDSYTAGPGIPNQTADSGGCGRSDHNYPHLVAAELGVARFTDVSCGSATTADMAAQQALPGGLTNGPQLDALANGADLVTLGIGGNDIGFGEIMVTCATHSLLLPITAPCKAHYSRNGDELGQRIDATAPKVAAVLAAIRERAPAARVLVVGYPVILPASGPGCWPIMPVAVGDVAWLRAVQ